MNIVEFTLSADSLIDADMESIYPLGFGAKVFARLFGQSTFFLEGQKIALQWNEYTKPRKVHIVGTTSIV